MNQRPLYFQHRIEPKHGHQFRRKQKILDYLMAAGLGLMLAGFIFPSLYK